MTLPITEACAAYLAHLGIRRDVAQYVVTSAVAVDRVVDRVTGTEAVTIHLGEYDGRWFVGVVLRKTPAISIVLPVPRALLQEGNAELTLNRICESVGHPIPLIGLEGQRLVVDRRVPIITDVQTSVTMATKEAMAALVPGRVMASVLSLKPEEDDHLLVGIAFFIDLTALLELLP